MPDYNNTISEKHYISISQKESLLSFLSSEYGLDFSEYSEASVRRRLTKILNEHNIGSIDGFIEYLKNLPEGRDYFLQKFTVNVTEMFRDPAFYNTLIEKVFVEWQKKEHVRIWSAGCSSGEEVLSLAILLEEHGLLEKTHIIGTDLNKKVLKDAKNSSYSMRHVKTYSRPYEQAGGNSKLELYYTTTGDQVKFNPSLYESLQFEQMDLMSESPKGEFDMVICRNVLIYFMASLQNKVIQRLYEKVIPRGILALGSKESVIFFNHKKAFQEIESESKIYRKTR